MLDKDTLRHFFESTPTAPIPERMHSDFSKVPFQRCLVSDMPLCESEFYMIQKVFNKRGEATMEMAVIFDEADKLSSRYSEGSYAHVQTFLHGRYNGNTELDLCSFCETGRYGDEDFMIGMWCSEGRYLQCPMTMCGGCQMELADGLSQETKDNDRRFRDKYFPGIPKDFGIVSPSFV